MESKVFRLTQEEVLWVPEWSEVVSAEVSAYYTSRYTSRLLFTSQLTPQKLKLISSLFELDINASQACNCDKITFKHCLMLKAKVQSRHIDKI